MTPTKETIFDIARALKLSPTEISYLLNDQFMEITESELVYAKSEFQKATKTDGVISYLLDPKGIVLDVSNAFRLIASQLGIDVDAMIGKQVIEILLDPQVGVRQAIAPENFAETVKNVLAVSKYERQYQLNEDWWKNKVAELSKYPEFVQAWEELKDTDVNLYGAEARTMHFRNNGLDMGVLFFTNALHHDPRFLYVEYTVINNNSISA